MKHTAFVLALLLATGMALAATTVPGHTDRYDKDHNGIPDAGQYVNGHYTALYAYDTTDYYWDLGDGRIQKTVDSIDDLDAATLTTCHYEVTYRADFGNDPYMDSGWIINNIRCVGYEPGNYNSLIVSSDNPRYTGDPDLAIWGTWEYHTDVWSGSGNMANPQKHLG